MKMVTKALVLSAAIGAAGLSLPAHAWWGGGPWGDNDRYDRSYNDWDWGPFDGWGDGDMSFSASARGSGRGRGRGHHTYDGYSDGYGYPYGGYYDRPYYGYGRPYYEPRGYGYPEGYGYPPPPPRYGAPPPPPAPKEKDKE